MSNRDKLIHDFLVGTHWADWDKHPVTGDASTRRYLRLSCNDKTAILMDADPKLGQDTEPFATIGQWLRDQGLSAPRTYLHNQTHGLMLIEDLGSTDFAIHLKSRPQDADKLYSAATDILARLDDNKPPAGLIKMTPDVGGEMLAITPEWYAGGTSTSLQDEMTAHLNRLCGPPNRIALRDFHAENLIWREDCTGADSVGLLDYQDAFIAPRGYDLVSLLRDVRRNVDKKLATKMTDRFIQKTQASSNAAEAFACLAVQRNLRILGVFARLALRDNKTRYVKMIPHIWSMITEDLTRPALSDLRTCVQSTLPAPEKSNVGGLL